MPGSKLYPRISKPLRRLALRIPVLNRYLIATQFQQLSRHISGPDRETLSYCSPDQYSDLLMSADQLRQDQAAYTTNGILKHIHYCYGFWDGSDQIPQDYIEKIKTWKFYHPDWKLVLWNRPTVKRLIQQHFPQWEEAFSQLSKPIQQADIARYLIIYAFGGMYVDMDVECRGHIAKMFADYPNGRVFVAVERRLNETQRQATALYPIRQGNPEIPERIGNYWILSCSKHPVIWNLIKLVLSRIKLPITSQYDVLYTTGGDPMTETIHRHQARTPDLVILPKDEANQIFRHRSFGGWREQAP